MVEGAHKDTFKNGNREWQFVPTQVIFRNKKNAEKSDADRAARVEGLLAKEKERRIRLKELGIDYDFPGFQGVIDSAASKLPAKSKSKAKKAEEPAPAKEEPKQRRSSRGKSQESEVIEAKSPKSSKKSKSKK